MNVDLIEFMRTGRFGKIELGATVGDVLAILGSPENETPSAVSPVIFKFGSTEFMFAGEDLVSVEQKLTEEHFWPTIEISTESLRLMRSLQEPEFLDCAATHGIRVVERKRLHYAPETTIFILEHQVRVVFHDEASIALSILSA